MRVKYILCVISVALLASGFNMTAGFAETTPTPQANHIVVYYFHGNFRCVNCRNLERYTREAVEKYFPGELSAGKIIFKVVNVETKGNEHFTQDYQLYTKSVVLSSVKGQKEARFDNLTKVWEYLNDKAAFYQYIKSEIEKYLKELS